MILDTRTLLVIMFFQTLVFGACLIGASFWDYTGSGQKSLRVLGIALLLQTVGWGLGALRGLTADFLSIVVANTVLIGSDFELYQGIRAFDEQPLRRRPALALTALVAVLLLIFTYASPNLSARIALVSLASLLAMLACGVQLVAPPPGVEGKVRRVVGCGILMMACVYSLRVVAAVAGWATPASLLENSLAQTLTFGGTSMAIALLALGFLLMANERFNHTLKGLSQLDPLTGLYNRREAERRTQIEITRAAQARHPLAYLLIDADHLKSINDTYGHQVGDQALQRIADALKAGVRAGDTVARIGGDEFAVTLAGTPAAEAEQVAARLEETVRCTYLPVGGRSIPLSVTVGLAMLDPTTRDYPALFRSADQRLYARKRSRAFQPLESSAPIPWDSL
jgi:diguanylate cyclase (GGDEF)-like protein